MRRGRGRERGYGEERGMRKERRERGGNILAYTYKHTCGAHSHSHTHTNTRLHNSLQIPLRLFPISLLLRQLALPHTLRLRSAVLLGDTHKKTQT